MLTVKYERKDFFGNRVYTEDVKKNPTLKDIQKAFRFLKTDYNIAIQINNTVLFWESLSNFEHGTLTCREYDEWHNYKDFAWSYDSCKNNYYAIYKNID